MPLFKKYYLFWLYGICVKQNIIADKLTTWRYSDDIMAKDTYIKIKTNYKLI